MNYCQELPNVELIVWQLEHAEKHQKVFFKYKKVNSCPYSVYS